jgi:hypothetical protein
MDKTNLCSSLLATMSDSSARVLFRRKLAKHSLRQCGDPQVFACRLRQCAEAESVRFRVRRAASTKSSAPQCCPRCWVPWVPSVTVRVRLVRKPTRARRRVISNDAVHTCLSCFLRLPLPVAVRGYVRSGEDLRLTRRRTVAASEPAAVKSKPKGNKPGKTVRPVVAAAAAAVTPKQKIAAVVASSRERKTTTTTTKAPSLLTQFLQKL